MGSLATNKFKAKLWEYRLMSKLDELLKTLRDTTALDDDRPEGLAGIFYTSADFFELEKKHILHNGWHCVGRADQIAKPGDYFTLQLLDDPIVIVRNDDGEIHALANVCRHRGMMLAEGAGNTKRFVCSYHAWSYARDGKLVRAAHMNNTGFDPAKCNLENYSCEIWQGFVYVNLSRNPPALSPQLGKLDELIAPYEPARFQIVHTAEEDWHCNWKCLVENFMEGYHLSVVHPETLRSYTPTELCTKGPSGDIFTSYHANYPDNIPPRGHGANKLTKEQRHRSSLFSVFPTQVASQAANLLVSLSLHPVSVGHVKVRWTMSVYNDDLDEETINQRIALWTKVNREDREKLEKLQISLKSSKAFPGPLAEDKFEGTIRNFHQFLSRSTSELSGYA